MLKRFYGSGFRNVKINSSVKDSPCGFLTRAEPFPNMNSVSLNRPRLLTSDSIVRIFSASLRSM